MLASRYGPMTRLIATVVGTKRTQGSGEGSSRGPVGDWSAMPHGAVPSQRDELHAVSDGGVTINTWLSAQDRGFVGSVIRPLRACRPPFTFVLGCS